MTYDTHGQSQVVFRVIRVAAFAAGCEPLQQMRNERAVSLSLYLFYDYLP